MRGSLMRLAGFGAMAAVLAAAGACDLAEVAIVPGEDVIVVEAVLRTDQNTQQVLLHRTLQGRDVGTVADASVVVTGPGGTRYEFAQDGACYLIDRRYLESDSLSFHGTCYQSVEVTRWVQAGSTYDLRVETSDGRVILGRTTVPGAFGLTTTPSSPNNDFPPPFCSLQPNTTHPILWTSSAGAWSYVAQLRISGLRAALEPQGIGAPEPLELRGLAVSETDTRILLPSEFGVFERFQYDEELLVAIQGGFPDGVQMELV
ncbi:MAG TPA: DUF4249 family protein, partial [Longimicrobiaceae bacterium]|nr:DUF4249 family protein [Longimicrobiaceae bacterium]